MISIVYHRCNLNVRSLFIHAQTDYSKNIDSDSDWPMCHCAIGTGPLSGTQNGPLTGHTDPWIAKKKLFNSGFVKLVRRKITFFQTFKWLILNKLFCYWTLNVKHSTPPRNIAYILYIYIYILLAEYGMAETYFGRPSLRSMQCKMKV